MKKCTECNIKAPHKWVYHKAYLLHMFEDFWVCNTCILNIHSWVSYVRNKGGIK